MNINKKLVLIILLFFWPYYLFGQSIENKIDSVNSISYEKIVSNLQYHISVFSNNLNLARSVNYVKGQADALSNLALVHYLKGNYDKSTDFHFQAINLYEKNKMYKELSESYGEYGYQLKRRDLKKAVDYMRTGMYIALKYKIDSLAIAKLYDNYGVLQEMLNNVDSAFFYYTQALGIKKKYQDSLGIPFTLNKIAVLEASRGNFKEAYKLLDKSNQFRDKEFGAFGRAENLSIKADFLRMQNKIDSAIIYYEKCLQTSLSLGYNYLISYCYAYLTELYKQKGDFENALQYFENYTSYKDSLTNYQTNSTIAQLEINYETQQKIKLLRETELQLAQKNQQLIFSLITIFFLFVTSAGIYNYQKQKRKSLINELELRTKINSALIEKRIIQEKLEIARELHDNIGSQLTFLVTSIDHLILNHNANSLRDNLTRLREFGKETLKDLRNTVWAMKHENGDIETLVVKIYDLISKLKYVNTNIKVDNYINSDLRITSTQMLNVYRIAQEALQNAIKHSNASEIRIKFSDTENGFEIVVEDNGIGFDVKSMVHGDGLKNIITRCEKVNGTCKILSNSSGTKITCDFKLTLN